MEKERSNSWPAWATAVYELGYIALVLLTSIVMGGLLIKFLIGWVKVLGF